MAKDRLHFIPSYPDPPEWLEEKMTPFCKKLGLFNISISYGFENAKLTVHFGHYSSHRLDRAACFDLSHFKSNFSYEELEEYLLARAGDLFMDLFNRTQI